MNADSDQAFLSLLSSQRELLNRLNMEATAAASKCSHDPVSTRDLNSSNHRPACTNQSIAERRSSLDMIMSKRFSIGFGCDPLAFSLTDAKSELVPSSWKDEGMDLYYGDKRSKEDAFDFEDTKRRKKRRMSSLSFLSPMFFEDNLKQDRRDSITFGPDENDPLGSEDKTEEEPVEVKSKETKDDEVEDKEDSEAEDQQDKEEDDDDISTGSISVEPIDFAPQTRIDPVKFRETMEAFHKSMEMSQNTQQAIHDWDRKMGLKRSHSKTMRLSTRSRKKLRSIMKKELSALAMKC